MPRIYKVPTEWEKMPLGFYLRTGKGPGGWMLGGQKSELPGGEYLAYGPIPTKTLEKAIRKAKAHSAKTKRK